MKLPTLPVLASLFCLTACGEPEPDPEIEAALEAAEAGLNLLGDLIEVANAVEDRDLDKDLEVAADMFAEHAMNVLMGKTPEPAGDPQEGAPTDEPAPAPTEGEDGEPASPEAEEDPAPKTP
jgi:hypothetical protein